ncbi:hypothetical protein VV02_08310 [Luteipulveratus mongoliensis]|uniref:histidine kinase n=1 Tax=Luteipulveratus mongoliensis TaxID=571913 RepID=A0A0K1JQ91_9MICO|nr:hypothetical protein VV02_08310 [Luteipulveratus mongoliensis]
MTEQGRPSQQLTRMLRVVPLVVIGIVTSVSFTAEPSPTSSPAVLLVLLTFVLSGLGVVLRAPRRDPLEWGLVVAVIATAFVLMWLQPEGASVAGVFFGVSFLILLLRQRLVVSVVLIGVVAIAIAAGSWDGSLSAVLLTVLTIVSFFGVLVLAGQLTAANERTAQLIRELEDRRDDDVRAAELAERSRLAREMHDILAHSLSGLTLQLEGARLLAERQDTDPRIVAAVERAQTMARGGLEEARHAIGLLRDEVMPGPDELSTLATRFSDTHGISCAFTTTGEPRSLPPGARLAIYRVAQEALTNVAKHAAAERVDMTFTYAVAVVRLVVEDVSSRRPQRPDNTGGGYGLSGMRERAELIGGTLSAGTTAVGFRVALELPTTENV